MKHVFLLLLLCGCVVRSTETDEIIVEKQPGQNIVIVDEGGVSPIPPDSSDCAAVCVPPTVAVGETTTLSPGSAATVTDTDSGPNMLLKFGIPQGLQGPIGPQGPPGSGSGGSAGWTSNKIYDVTAYGANPNDTNNDLPAFQAASDAARANAGKVVIPSPGNNGAYYFDGTWNLVADATNQIWVDVEVNGGRHNRIRFRGPSGTAAVKIIGMKGGAINGLNISIENGRTNCQAIDIDTNGSASSTSFNTFRNFYITLGNGQNNVGIRTGLVSGGNGDISNYNFENIIVYGGGGLYGASIPGQYGHLNIGNNTLSMVYFGGFVALCDRAYANKWVDGKRGNGSVMFYGLGCSSNNIDFEFDWEGAYIISGGRFENGKKFLRVSEDGGYAEIIVQGINIHGYKSDDQIDVFAPCGLTLEGVTAATVQNNVYYNSCINLAANRAGHYAVLNMQNCSFSLNTAKPYKKSGATQWDITSVGVTKINGVWSNVGFFPNEVGVRTAALMQVQTWWIVGGVILLVIIIYILWRRKPLKL